MTFYTTMTLSQSKKVVDAFEKKYPSIDVELFRTGGDALLNKIFATPIRRLQANRGASRGLQELQRNHKPVSRDLQPGMIKDRGAVDVNRERGRFDRT